eukprot:TRINITY_DN103139_c0_g1_i1.p1 TRINITY_DN103139_c0_g1~~TRINITY_DN103139_c0_g1_i1.p1  ORF type:complete len:218 (-),score=35.48 TRINITY_DN103139_c0_g1_i1:140-793(-)
MNEAARRRTTSAAPCVSGLSLRGLYRAVVAAGFAHCCAHGAFLKQSFVEGGAINASIAADANASLPKIPLAFKSVPPSEAARIAGMCLRPGGPACTTLPCCCWSSYAAVKHPTYDDVQDVHMQQCRNPPEGYVYSTSNDAEVEALMLRNLPKFEGRRLCCLEKNSSAAYYSHRDVAQAAPRYRSMVSATVENPTQLPPLVMEPPGPAGVPGVQPTPR